MCYRAGVSVHLLLQGIWWDLTPEYDVVKLHFQLCTHTHRHDGIALSLLRMREWGNWASGPTVGRGGSITYGDTVVCNSPSPPLTTGGWVVKI